MDTIYIVFEITQRKGYDREVELYWYPTEAEADKHAAELNATDQRNSVYFEVRALERFRECKP